MAASRSASLKMMLGALPPSSSETFLRFFEAPAAIFLPTSVRAGEGDLVDVEVVDERGARVAEAGQDVDDAGGDAGLEQQLAEVERGERGLLGGLEHDGVAGGDRRDDLEGRHGQREVPRHDAGDDADRLATGVGVELAARHRHRDGGALHLGGPAGEVAEQLGGDADVAAGGREALAVVERLELGELLGALVDQVADAPQQVRALARGHPRPRRAGLEGVAGGDDGAVGVDGRGLGDLDEDLLGGRVDGVEGLAVLRVDPLAVDQELPGRGEERGDGGEELGVLRT